MADLKILYFDTETTGLDVNIHDIVQLAGVLEINGKTVETFNYDVRPFNLSTVSSEALDITGKSLDELSKYPDPRLVHGNFIQMLGKYINKYDKTDKAYPAGYNVGFDMSFLRSFFEKCDDPYFGSWFHYRPLDPLPILYMLETMGKIKLENYKLGTVCNALNLNINAHDANSDILATMGVFDYVKGFFKSE